MHCVVCCAWQCCLENAHKMDFYRLTWCFKAISTQFQTHCHTTHSTTYRYANFVPSKNIKTWSTPCRTHRFLLPFVANVFHLNIFWTWLLTALSELFEYNTNNRKHNTWQHRTCFGALKHPLSNMWATYFHVNAGIEGVILLASNGRSCKYAHLENTQQQEKWCDPKSNFLAINMGFCNLLTSHPCRCIL